MGFEVKAVGIDAHFTYQFQAEIEGRALIESRTVPNMMQITPDSPVPDFLPFTRELQTVVKQDT